jgi:hypothetical protein
MFGKKNVLKCPSTLYCSKRVSSKIYNVSLPVIQVLDQFCASHPQLEHLHFDGFCRVENEMSFKCQWALVHFKLPFHSS